ncbi:MAG: tRNA adenosine(34) deaminase TadA [Acidimicrobiales bacterium]
MGSHSGRHAEVTDADNMEIALVEARAALDHGDVPVGAVVVVEGQVIARSHNKREASSDPTAHAEVLALRAAAQTLGTWRLDQATLVVTLEPCPMCAGAAVAARLGRLVFGAYDPKSGACGSLYNICSDPRLNHEVALVPGVLAVEAREMLEHYFRERRPSPPSARQTTSRGSGSTLAQ